MRPVELITELQDFDPLLEMTAIENATKSTQDKVETKPKKFRYVPPLVNFNTIIRHV